MANSETRTNERRLWIGNLDFRITEYVMSFKDLYSVHVQEAQTERYQLLKIVQQYGVIEKFDLLFHRNGPQAGQPRGYAFVTYVRMEDAQNAKEKLHNKQIGQKKVNVTWAQSMSNEEITKPQEQVYIPVLAISKPIQKSDRESQIQAIEAKLKLMEKKKCVDELKINDTVSTKSPIITQFQQKKLPYKSHNTSVKTKIAELRKLKPYQKSHNNWR